MSKLANPKPIIGWDIGGAHLKAVLLDEHGDAVQILQLPCSLWKGLNHLEVAMNDVLQAFKIGPSGACHAVTMTGELVDLFVNRQAGVIEISKLTAKLLGKDTLFYAALPADKGGFVTLAHVAANAGYIASANWHASASALGNYVADALFIDIGSTTTDIIAIERGKVKSLSLSDASRMADDSLVYTGVVRTPVMALAQKLAFEGVEVNVAAENFATMADVYRLTSELLPEFDSAETADGKGKNSLETARRLARMIGHDVEDRPLETWKNLAETCKKLHMQQIKTAVLKHLKPGVPIIGAGAGGFLVKKIADDLGREFMHACKPISMRLAEHVNLKLQSDLELCFSAFAVAILARQYA
jgi:(4-(4-[2-(gamma-L-glutamylamino)ethyl]phenoxymethyl)furan-2-yl)methanamine synthase